MAETNGVVISISGDSKDLEKALQNASKSVLDVTGKLKQQESSFDGLNKKVFEFDKITGTSFGSLGSNISSTISSFGTLGVAVGGVALIAGTAFAAFKFAEIGEELEKKKKQFDSLAESAGIFGDRLIEGLEKSAGGLVDTDDLINVANGSILKLGNSAKNLPELFELSQKSVKVFGGDAIQNLELISNSIGNLQTKQLSKIGINVDAESTFKAYAKGLKTTADQLTETEKKQALLNAVLESGNEKFKNISTGVNDVTISNGLKKVAVGFDSVKDSIAAIANTKLGGAFAELLGASGEALSTFSRGIDSLAGKQPTLQQQLDSTNQKIREYTELSMRSVNFSEQASEQVEMLKKVKAQLEENINFEKLMSEEKQRQADFKAIPKNESRPASEVETKAIEESLLKQQELKAQEKQVELDSISQHNLNKLAIEETYGVQSQVYKDAALQAELDKNQTALDAQEAKNLSIKNKDEKAAADSLALAKKNAADKSALDKKELDDKAKVSEAKVKIEENLFATAAILASDNAELTKAINIAQAVRNTYQGASLALATYPPPFNAIAAATTVGLGLAQVAKITAAADGGLVTGGAGSRVDDQPFMLARGEIVAPAKSFDEVVEGTARARGFVKDGEGGSSSQSINISIQGDFIGDDNYINNLTKKIQEAVQFRDAQLT